MDRALPFRQSTSHHGDTVRIEERNVALMFDQRYEVLPGIANLCITVT